MTALQFPEWQQVFVPDLALAESVLRGSLVYLALIVLFRVVLKRQSGSIGLPDVMLVVLVSECVSNSLSANAKSVPNGLVAVATLLFWNYALDRLAERWSFVRRLLEPPPVQIVQDGRPVRRNLDAEGITDDELAAQLREHGVDDVAKVKAAFVESGGSVSVIEKGGAGPAPVEPARPAAPAGVPTGGDERQDTEHVVRQFVEAAEALRGVIEGHEQKAAEHRAAARAVRELLAARGAGPRRKKQG